MACINATPWHLAGQAGAGGLGGHLTLWRFDPYYRLSADQLPAVLHRETLDPATLRFQRWQHAGQLTAIESIERRSDDNRRVRYAVAVGFVSAVAIPASLTLA